MGGTKFPIEFPSLFAAPHDSVKKIVDFVGDDRLPYPSAMLEVIDPALYRQQSVS